MAVNAVKAHLITLKAHKNRLARTSMREMFAEDAKRFKRFSIAWDRLLFDYSKHRLDERSLAALLDVAKTAGVKARRDAMFSGKIINATEGRAVLHTALRAPSGELIEFDGRNVMADIAAVRRAMTRFANAVRSGRYKVGGGAITDVVNIGIGGSSLGPAMAARALAPWHNGPKTHFVSNVDAADLAEVFKVIRPETTLFIIASKTFTTQETMRNAATARAWLRRKLKRKDVGAHFAALSTSLDKTRKFGIADERTFGFWDWVGGRYSVWSAIGLSVMIAIGPKRFGEFLDGAHEADTHFRTADYGANIPVVMALLGVWYRNVWGFETHAVLPYDNRLARFPAYLQQLEMESNGKRVMMDGRAVSTDTGAILWGEPGTDGQHAFYQLIHQGTSVIPCDFLIAAKSNDRLSGHHELLVANCLAQSEALMTGRTLGEAKAELAAAGLSAAEVKRLAPHKVFEGNRPSTTFLYERLDPKMLGTLIALYEHKVFVQGVLWGINSFDQWGVELGKVLANDLIPMVRGKKPAGRKDASTAGLLAAYHRKKR
ncbi:glucose-6-phosphate isomerase [Salaquimonas pukyongi]|uniref:glucose-6-phosphate isomerase n=1 Tax=Salaquimonas pukyongi TaxID=2712698 RepID=UPI00096BB327|nr:glucose-6-phosphate isomerase [Salaquimonas pukyongi]